jgi:hypothetical protein
MGGGASKKKGVVPEGGDSGSASKYKVNSKKGSRPQKGDGGQRDSGKGRRSGSRNSNGGRNSKEIVSDKSSKRSQNGRGGKSQDGTTGNSSRRNKDLAKNSPGKNSPGRQLSPSEKWKKAKNKTVALSAFGSGVKAGTKADKFAWIAKECSVTSVRDLELGKVVGAGLTAQVRLTRIAGQGKFCAVKCVRKRRVGRECDVHRLMGEKQALQNCMDGAFTVKLFNTLQDKSYLYFVMEYAVGGELFHRLQEVSGLLIEL